MISKAKLLDYVIVITLAVVVGGASIIYHGRQTECIESVAQSVESPHLLQGALNCTSHPSANPAG